MRLKYLSAVILSASMFATGANATTIFEGCTPGYWKNHTDAWEVYLTTDLVGDTFVVPPELANLADDTLLTALKYGGGSTLEGGAMILFRAAVAALLNSVSDGVVYSATEAAVLEHVEDTLATLNRAEYVRLAGQLDRMNNFGCPLN